MTGEEIKTLRREKGLTQRQLAELIGTTPTRISEMENNRLTPRPYNVKMLELIQNDTLKYEGVPGPKKREKAGSPKAVQRIDEAGKVLGEWASIRQAAKALGFTNASAPMSIGKAAASKFATHYKKMLFRFVETEKA